MPSRKIEHLNPDLAKKAALLIKKCKESGIEIIITCTARSESEQKALYAQGRQQLFIVNELRDDAGMSLIRESENKVVTWTLDSKHVIGAKRSFADAFDIAVMKNGKIDWADIDTYKQVASIGKEIGLKAGADFKTPDYPHFEKEAG